MASRIGQGRRTDRVLGVDGCPTGWVGILIGADEPVPASRPAALADPSTGPAEAVFGATIGELVAHAALVADVAAVAVDIPIHLSDDQIRPCDALARRHLGRKQSSLFATPIRAALQASTYEEALARSRSIIGKGISRQAWALRTKILDVGTWLPDAPCPVYEVHPEVSFSLMTGAPILARKSSWAGLALRRAALRTAGIEVPDEIGEAGHRARPDDVLDAAAAAWSARRIASGTATSLPDPPVALPDGRLQAIWA